MPPPRRDRVGLWVAYVLLVVVVAAVAFGVERRLNDLERVECSIAWTQANVTAAAAGVDVDVDDLDDLDVVFDLFDELEAQLVDVCGPNPNE